MNYEDNTPTHNPIRHTTDVVFSIIGGMMERNPLRYLCLPGLLLMLGGTGAVALFLREFIIYHGYFSIPFAFLAVLLIISGLFTFMFGLVLHGISHTIEKLETHLNARLRR